MDKEEEKSIITTKPMKAPGDLALLIPPMNFAMVVPGIYRSGYPIPPNFAFLRRLGLRSIIYMCPEEYADESEPFIREENINVMKFGVPGSKEPFILMPEATIRDAISALLDVRNHPCLIHCNKGKHRTGCVVGCLRKVQKWSLTSIFDEYRRFCGSKVRMLDQQFIELFSEDISYNAKHRPAWLND